MPRTLSPCPSATNEWPNSWASTETNNRIVATVPASQYCCGDQKRKNEGNALVENVHVMMANAINQVTLMSTGIPRIVKSFSDAGN